MDKLLFDFNEIYLYKLCKKSIPDFCRFTLMTNYYAHQGDCDLICIDEELQQAIKEDIRHYDSGHYFVAKNKNNETIGGIKAIHMDNMLLQDFLSNADLGLSAISMEAPHVWLVGRFAVDSKAFKRNKNLLPLRSNIYKILMLEVIDILKNNLQDLLIAEVDTGLLRKFRFLNINMTQIGKPRLIYGSYASLAYIRVKDLMVFYNKNKHLTISLQ